MKSSQTVVLTVHKGNSTYVDAKMQVDVDFVALARALARRAMRSKFHRAVIVGGAVVVRHLPEKRST